MTKRLIALFLAALMLLSLAACGEKKPVEEETAAVGEAEEYHGELPFVKEGDEPVTVRSSAFMAIFSFFLYADAMSRDSELKRS